jgi:hypothetical protein
VWTVTRADWPFLPEMTLDETERWSCLLCWNEGGVPGPIMAKIRADLTDDRWIVSLTFGQPGLHASLVRQMAEFVAYAAQGKDAWIRVKPDDQTQDGLLSAGYAEHERTEEYVEYTHDWPPGGDNFKFNVLTDPDTGKLLNDWRDDLWGGKAVT